MVNPVAVRAQALDDLDVVIAIEQGLRDDDDGFVLGVDLAQ